MMQQMNESDVLCVHTTNLEAEDWFSSTQHE